MCSYTLRLHRTALSALGPNMYLPCSFDRPPILGGRNAGGEPRGTGSSTAHSDCNLIVAAESTSSRSFSKA